MINYTFKQQLPESLENLILEHKGSMVKGHLDLRIAETLTDKEPPREFKTIDMLINIDFNEIDVLWIKQHQKYDLQFGENLFDSESELTFNWVSNTYSLSGESKSGLDTPEAIISLEQFAGGLDQVDSEKLTFYRKPAGEEYILCRNPGFETETKFVIFDIEEFHRGVLREIREDGKKPYFSSERCLSKLIGMEGMKDRCFDSYSDLFDMINTSTLLNPSGHLLAEIEIRKVVIPSNI